MTEEILRVVGRDHGRRLVRDLARATYAYEHDRYHDAFRMTRPLVDLVPESASVRELHGLVCYRLGRWREAAKNLEESRDLAGGDASQLPVIMDCRRALGQRNKLEEAWGELRSASPPADVLSEGRLVLAAHRAERADLDGAIDLLVSSGAARRFEHPAERHIREWYVLADLYERAGDLPRARDLFARVAAADPELADARVRREELGSAQRNRRRRPVRRDQRP